MNETTIPKIFLVFMAIALLPVTLIVAMLVGLIAMMEGLARL